MYWKRELEFEFRPGSPRERPWNGHENLENRNGNKDVRIKSRRCINGMGKELGT